MNAFNVNIPAPLEKAFKTVIKLKFNRFKFMKENYKCDCKSSLNDHYKQLAKLRIHTNYTNFEIELFIYDNLIEIVSLKIKLLLN
jgi:hypothetical protein